MKKTKAKKRFDKYILKKWSWLELPVHFPTGIEMPCCNTDINTRYCEYCSRLNEGAYDAFRGQLERVKTLKEALYKTLALRSINEIQKKKGQDQNYYWGYLNLKDYRRKTIIS